MRRIFFLSLAAAAACFLALRLAGIFGGAEFYAWPEEMVRGTLGRELMTGLQRPLWDYQADLYDGGSLVSGGLAFVFFKIMGPSWLALKFSALVFPLASLILLMIFLNRFFSLRAAVYGGFLFAFAPPAFARLSTLAIGAWFESIFFILVIFTLLYEILWKREEGKARGLFILLGLAGGIACWYTASNFTVFLTAVFCLLFFKRISFSLFVRLSAGFAAGFLPFIAYNFAHGWQGLRFLLSLFADPPANPGSFLLAAIRLPLYDFPQSFGFPGGIFWNAAYCLLAAAMMISGLLVYKKEPRRLPLLVFTVLYSGLFILGDFHLSFGRDFFLCRYFSCLYLSMVLFCAIMASRAGLARAAFAGMLILSISGNQAFWSLSGHGRPSVWSGYAYADLGGVWAEKPFSMPEGFKGLVLTLNRYNREQAQKIAYGYFFSSAPQERPAGPAEIRSMIQESPDFLWPFLLGWWGADFAARGERNAEAEAVMGGDYSGMEDFFYWKYHSDLHLSGPEGFILSGLPPASERWFYFYAGVSAADWKHEKFEGVEILSPEQKKWFYRGLGAGCAARMMRGFYADRSFSYSGPFMAGAPGQEANIAWGAGWAFRTAFPEDFERFRDRVETFPEKLRDAALRGGQAFDAFLFPGVEVRGYSGLFQ